VGSFQPVEVAGVTAHFPVVNLQVAVVNLQVAVVNLQVAVASDKFLLVELCFVSHFE